MTYAQALQMGRIRARSQQALKRMDIPSYIRLDRLSFEVEHIQDTSPEVHVHV